MKHNNIAIFVPHAGCPECCSFCNQKAITEQEHIPDGEEVTRICAKAMAEISNPEDTEIAFFGGSFTAIPNALMLELLEAAALFVGDGKFSGIRVSTRPDAIDARILACLKEYGVTAIELGAQSMSDAVLSANRRGHTAADVVQASRMIQKFGFSLGLQMMVGLYQSTMEDEWKTVKKILEIHPDTVRIYPTVVLKGTELERHYTNGQYRLFSFESVVDFCADAMILFAESGIRVIKCGLHPSELVEQDMKAGFYHPAFRELCEGRIYRQKMEQVIQEETGRTEYLFAVHPACISKAVGHRKANLLYFQEQGICVRVTADAEMQPYECRWIRNGRQQCI